MIWLHRAWGTFLALVLGVLMLLYAADFFLRHYGDQISEAAMEFLPEADISFSSARLKLGWGSAAVRVSDLEVGEFVTAPEADVWVNPEGLAAVLYSPDITLGSEGGGGLPLAGSWAVDARDANITWRGMLVTLRNARLQLKREDDLLRAQLDEYYGGISLHVRAHIRGDREGIVGASIYAETDGLLKFAEVGPPWDAVRATVRAEVSSTENMRFSTEARLPGSSWNLRGSGGWNPSRSILTMSVVSEGAPLNSFPGADAYARGTLYYEEERWRGDGFLFAMNEDGKMGADIIWNGESFDADIRFGDVEASSLKKYITYPDVRKWFEESVDRGEIYNARMKLQNAPLSTTAELTAAFSGVRIEIAEGWPAAENLSGILAIRGDDIVIHGGGDIGDVSADNILARMPSVSAEKATLYLDTLFNRERTEDYLQTASEIVVAGPAVSAVTGQVDITGASQLSLQVITPLATPKDSDFFGRLEFTGDGIVDVIVGEEEDPSPPLEDVAGIADIDSRGVRATLTGSLHGRSVTVHLLNDDIMMHGRIAATTALSMASISGVDAGGESEFRLIRDEEATVFVSDMHGITLDMPSPFNKPAGDKADLSVTMRDGDSRARLETGGNIINFHASESGTDIAFNTESLPPPRSGVNVHGTAEGLSDAEGWFGRVGDTEAAISLRITDSHFMNAWHEELILESSELGEGKQLVLNGARIAGTVLYHPGKLDINLSRLMMDEVDDEERGGEWRLAELTVDINVEDFDYDKKGLGHVVMKGEPELDGWRINTLHAMTEENEFVASGFYDGINTEITAQIESADAVALLSIFGQSDIISEGTASASGRLFWPASPSDFSLTRLGGRLSLQAEDVRYIKTGSGVIGLLAVLSPQSLLELGFTEIGKDGLQLDEMSGVITFEDGSAYFHDVVMRNEDLSIIMVGEIDIVSHTLNIRGRVRPGNRVIKAGSTAALGAGLVAVQPLSIAAGWLLGKVLERPLSEIGAYNYAITGDWDAPEYVETGVVLKPPPEQQQQPQQ